MAFKKAYEVVATVTELRTFSGNGITIDGTSADNEIEPAMVTVGLSVDDRLISYMSLYLPLDECPQIGDKLTIRMVPYRSPRK